MNKISMKSNAEQNDINGSASTVILQIMRIVCMFIIFMTGCYVSSGYSSIQDFYDHESGAALKVALITVPALWSLGEFKIYRNLTSVKNVTKIMLITTVALSVLFIIGRYG